MPLVVDFYSIYEASSKKLQNVSIWCGISLFQEIILQRFHIKGKYFSADTNQPFGFTAKIACYAMLYPRWSMAESRRAVEKR
jgi:hypothetical protein